MSESVEVEAEPGKVQDRRKRPNRRQAKKDGRLALAVGVIVMLLGLLVFDTVQVVSATSGLRGQQGKIAQLERGNRQIALVARQVAVLASQKVDTLSAQRRRTVKLICHTTNELVRNLKALIVDGAKSSKPFDPLYKEFGAPPFQVRLAQAEQQARSIQPVDCPALH